MFARNKDEEKSLVQFLILIIIQLHKTNKSFYNKEGTNYMNKVANTGHIFKLHTTIMCDRKRFCNKLRKLQNVRIEREYSLQMIADEGITFSICTFHQQSLNIRNWDPHVNLVQPINHKRQCK